MIGATRNDRRPGAAGVPALNLIEKRIVSWQ
jgi:hypothetical protein